MPSNLQIGKLGEQIASSFLKEKKISVIETNYRTKLGEIDIIGKKDNKLLFIEVKTRIGVGKGQPYEAVTQRKLSHLKTAATLYVLKNNLKSFKLSVQVISIILKNDLTIEKIQYFEDVLL